MSMVELTKDSENDSGIIYMERRFKNGLTEVLDYIEKVKSILLW